VPETSNQEESRWRRMLWSIVSNATEISRRHKQETCWWLTAETSLLYRETRRVSKISIFTPCNPQNQHFLISVSPSPVIILPPADDYLSASLNALQKHLLSLILLSTFASCAKPRQGYKIEWFNDCYNLSVFNAFVIQVSRTLAIPELGTLGPGNPNLGPLWKANGGRPLSAITHLSD